MVSISNREVDCIKIPYKRVNILDVRRIKLLPAFIRDVFNIPSSVWARVKWPITLILFERSIQFTFFYETLSIAPYFAFLLWLTMLLTIHVMQHLLQPVYLKNVRFTNANSAHKNAISVWYTNITTNPVPQLFIVSKVRKLLRKTRNK